MQRADAIVVGAGVMGAATAWSLARRGRSVVVLEQFRRGHDRGSSHGASRIFRLAYPDPFWIDLARRAQRGWRTLEAEADGPLLVETGSVDHGDPGTVAALGEAMTAAAVLHDVLDPAAAGARWPGITFAGPVCHQPQGGRIQSADALAAFLDGAVRAGAVLLEETPVRALEPAADRVRVVTDDETYDAGVAVVAAGAWVGPLLGTQVALPRLTVTQESAFHFAAREAMRWPSAIHYGTPAVYSLETPGEGIKVAEHHTGPVTTAAARDGVVGPAARARVVEFVTRTMPGLEPTPVTQTTCLYTSTANEDFVLDRRGPIVVASPCSGHGFKFAPLIGELAADLAGGDAPVERFALPSSRAPAR